MVFVNEEHKRSYYEKLAQVRYRDCYHRALIYILGISEDTRKHFKQIYDIKSGCIKTECLHRGWQTSGKLLYGLMLDRMSLSMKNGWLDDENRAYIIYAVENIMEDLGCSKPTCIKVMRELDADNGIGLIEKKRRGLGKPDIIYVKNFTSVPEKESAEKPANTDVSTEVKNLYFKK